MMTITGKTINWRSAQQILFIFILFFRYFMCYRKLINFTFLEPIFFVFFSFLKLFILRTVLNWRSKQTNFWDFPTLCTIFFSICLQFPFIGLFFTFFTLTISASSLFGYPSIHFTFLTFVYICFCSSFIKFSNCFLTFLPLFYLVIPLKYTLGIFFSFLFFYYFLFFRSLFNCTLSQFLPFNTWHNWLGFLAIFSHFSTISCNKFSFFFHFQRMLYQLSFISNEFSSLFSLSIKWEFSIFIVEKLFFSLYFALKNYRYPLPFNESIYNIYLCTNSIK